VRIGIVTHGDSVVTFWLRVGSMAATYHGFGCLEFAEYEDTQYHYPSRTGEELGMGKG